MVELDDDDLKRIVIFSDGTGKTAKRLMDAVLSQYSGRDIDFKLEKIFQEVRTSERVDEILENMDDDYLVIFSCINEELSQYIHKRLQELGIMNINVLEPMLNIMSKFLGVHPDYQPGILQRIDDRYYKKIDAIGFTVEHDDGMGGMIDQADIVLVGLSRSCKTPISMYLACNYGFKVANIPLVPDAVMENNLLKRLDGISPTQIFGLTISAEVLAHVREERSTYLSDDKTGQAQISSYFDVHTIREEIRYCRRLFSRMGWETIDVTRRAIEEISIEILESLGHKSFWDWRNGMP